MNVFVLHSGQPELVSFLGALRVPSGTAVPRQDGRVRLRILSFRQFDRWSERHDGQWLQQAEAVRLASNAQRRTRHLRMHGLRSVSRQPAGAGEAALLRRYVIPVFQLDALGVYTTGPAQGALRAEPRSMRHAQHRYNRLRMLATDAKPAAVRRAERAAVRAVYALGLDYAVVTVCSSADGQPVIEALDPSPMAASEPFGPLYAEAIHRMAETFDAYTSNTGEIMLGLDPEFVLRRPGPGGKIVFASRYFPRRGRVGCDSVRIGDKLVYPLAELRPSPAAEPQELFRNLYAAMRLAASRIDDASLEWLAGGMPARGLPLGGHIHVSGVPLDADLLRAMDNYMALPLVLLEDSTTGRRRPRYGALGDFRRQFHGGFEYRTLPSWIVSPAVAMGVIALAKVVCEHYRELTERPLANPEMQAHYYAGNKEALLPAAAKLWESLERTAAYQRYAKALRPLKKAVLSMQAWNEQQDVRSAWKIHP